MAKGGTKSTKDKKPEEFVKLNMTFEEAIKLAATTPLPAHLKKNKKAKK
jgi:hypothetical protein